MNAQVLLIFLRMIEVECVCDEKISPYYILLRTLIVIVYFSSNIESILLFLTAWNQIDMRQRNECCDGTEYTELSSK